MLRMVGGEKAEGLTEAQECEPIAPAPIVRGRATVPEEAILLLCVRCQEEMREQVEIAPLARETEGATEHGTVHEHVFGAVVWIRGWWRAAISSWAIALCHTHDQIRIAAIARDLGQLHAPDQASQGGRGGRVVKHAHRPGDIRFDQAHNTGYRVFVGGIQTGQAEPTADRHALCIDHWLQGMPIHRGQAASDLERCAPTAGLEPAPGWRGSQRCWAEQE